MHIRPLGAMGTVLVVALVLAGCGSGERTEVLGEVYERPSASTSLVDVKPVEAAPVVPPSTTTTVAVESATVVPPAPSTTAPPARPPATPAALQVTREFSDNAATVVVTGGELGAAVSSTTTEAGVANPFAFFVNLPLAGELLTIEIALTNATSSPVQLPAGLDVAVAISRDGQPWRVERVADAAVTAIPPGGTWSTTIMVPAEGDGSYDITGWIDVVHA